MCQRCSSFAVFIDCVFLPRLYGHQLNLVSVDQHNVIVWRPSVCLSVPSAYCKSPGEQHVMRPAYISARQCGVLTSDILLCLFYVIVSLGLLVCVWS